MSELLRARRPGAPVFANRTLGATLDAVAAHGASGICGEDFAPAHFESDETRSWMEGVAARLAAVRKKNPGFEVLALWVAPPGCGPTSPAREAMREKAASFGYRPFVSEGGYQSLPPEAAP